MAHRASSFRGRGVSQSQRRKKTWVQLTGPILDLNGASDGLLQSANMTLVIPAGTPVTSDFASHVGIFSDPVLDKVPEESTLLRLRGSINMPKNEHSATSTTNFAVGIGVMEAGAASLGAFPNPATPDGGAWDGWMFYRSQQQSNLDANSGVIDVKAMRKMQGGQSFVIVFGLNKGTPDGSVAGGTSAELMAINLRGLILLP